VREGKHNAGFLHDEQKAVMKQNQADPRDSEHALKCQLAAQVLRSFGTLRLEVTGLSMLPSVWPGDILFIERCLMREIAVGDIVLFARQGKLVAHRVLHKTAAGDNPHAITRGDALLSPDDAVSPAELLGSVRHILRAGEYVKPGADLSFRTRTISKLVRSFAWVARFLAFMHRLRGDRWRRETLCKS
jgi:signal peptidase I